MIVVSDASPLIALATIDQLKILRELYAKIIIPQAVYEEVVISGAGRPGSEEILNASWINTKSAENVAPYHALGLGPGETEAIALTLELNADLLLIDEVKARREAKSLGIHFVGILGILIEAKSEGMLDSVKPILEKLREEAGFRISQPLIDHVLRLVEEQ